MSEITENLRKALPLEEYKALKSEISVLDARVERGISTFLSINAVVLAVIYLDIIPWLDPEAVNPQALTAVELPLLIIMFLLNLIFGIRYYAITRHIDLIGGYIARIEKSVYRGDEAALGWELSLRGIDPVTVKKNETWIDRFRRIGFWAFLGLVNFLVFLDLTCVVPLSGVSACPLE